MDETIDVLKWQRDTLRRKLDAQNRRAIRPAALVLFALGLALIALCFAFEYAASGYDIAHMLPGASNMSLLLLLAGIAVVVLAILLYFLSPARSLRTEVADALALSGTENVEKLLASLLIDARGVYVPSAQAGATRLLIPVGGTPAGAGLPNADGGFFVRPGGSDGGVLLEPSGYRLLAHLREIGATFTPEGLENELKDALENSLELAGRVAVRRAGNEVHVTASDLANAGMCATIRKERPGACTQIGCPVCSLMACAIAEAARRRVVLDRVSVEGRTLSATFRLV
jgi:hypothetical protein